MGQALRQTQIPHSVKNATLTNRLLLGEDNRLHARDFEAFAAAHVFTHHHVVSAQHVGTGLGEAGAIALVRASRELAFLGAHQPANFIFSRLMAVRTVESCRLLVRAFVKKFAFFHARILHLSAGLLWQHDRMPKHKKLKKFRAVNAVKELARERIGSVPSAKIVPGRKKAPPKHKPTLKKLLDDAEL
jgi:hypothetical protein